MLKHGKTSGLTVGFANKPKSVIRSAGYESQEWCILPLPYRSFSRASDSGSLVWDSRRRMGGMIIARGGNRVDSDTTYATPMQRLLEDIRRKGYNVELP